MPGGTFAQLSGMVACAVNEAVGSPERGVVVTVTVAA
jgi:hypothetical protein